MQYLLSELQGRGSSAPGEAKSFNTISDVVRHLQKINKNKRLLIGDNLANADALEELLQQKLSTVSINVADEDVTWIVTAF